MKGCKLSAVALGLAFGVFWGVSILVIGLIAHFSTYAHGFVNSVGTLYTGYKPSIGGSILGGIIGFVDAFITGLILGGLYNLFCSCTCVCCDKKKYEEVIKDVEVKKVEKAKKLKKDEEII